MITPGGIRLTSRLWIVLFLAILVLFPVGAYSDTLDPTWAGGFWDDDDFDYVILLVGQLAAPVPVVLQTFAPVASVVGVVSDVPGAAPAAEGRLPFYRRGPPLA